MFPPALRLRRSGVARLGRERRQVLHQRQMEVRLGLHGPVRSLLPQRLPAQRTFDPSQYYFQDIVSSVYLRGQDGRGFFDLSGYHFQTTSAYRRSAPGTDRGARCSTITGPSRSIRTEAAGIGGEVTVDLNAANVNRTEALYQSVGAAAVRQRSYNLYSVCETRSSAPTTPAATSPDNCLLRGIAGDYARATGQVSWQRKIVDPIGEVWTPFVFARVERRSDGPEHRADTYVYGAYGTSTIPNSAPARVLQRRELRLGGDRHAGRRPRISLSLRLQFARSASRSSSRSPRSSCGRTRSCPGCSRTRTRRAWCSTKPTCSPGANIPATTASRAARAPITALQYTANFANGGHANFVGGESIQLAGQNSYTIADAANTGLESGLDKTISRTTSRAKRCSRSRRRSRSPASSSSTPRPSRSTRFDGIVSAHFGGFTASVDYGRYAAQPVLGWLYPREGLLTSASYKLDRRLTVDGGVALRHVAALLRRAGRRRRRASTRPTTISASAYGDDLHDVQGALFVRRQRPDRHHVGDAAAPGRATRRCCSSSRCARSATSRRSAGDVATDRAAAGRDGFHDR